jgi:beta-lactamase class A
VEVKGENDMFYDSSPKTRAIGEALVGWAISNYAGKGLADERFALTLLRFPAPLTPENAAKVADGFGYHGERTFYPCSIIKAFYMAAAEARLEEGYLQPHGELDRALRDMILWSSNTGTNYIIDLVTGTTGDTLLPEHEMKAWVERRNWTNRWLQSLGWAELAAVNASQKLMDDERYGREKSFVQMGGNNHNRLTSDAAARLLFAIFSGRLVTPARSRRMADRLRRPLDADFAAQPAAQIQGFFGAGLPAGARLWSKAGLTAWTGDADASYRRHDAAYIELPEGPAMILTAFTQGTEISKNESFLPDLAREASRLVTAAAKL